MPDKFEKWKKETFEPEHQFSEGDLKLAYDEGWHDGDEFQLDCHQDHEKYKLERLRDQIATSAMSGLISELQWEAVGKAEFVPKYHLLAGMAYSMADAMIKFRNGAE